MKRFLKFFIPFLVVLALLYVFRTPINERVLPFWELFKTQVLRQAPCKEPIPYLFGTFDTEFKISKEYFLSALKDAEAIWEKPSGLDLFDYQSENASPSALKINLIYDYRQQATSKLANLGITVKDNRASYDALKVKLTALKAAYEKDKKAFNARVTAFNKAQKDYKDKVDYWNKRGGAPEKDFEELQSTRSALERESNELENSQAKLNNQVDEINALVAAVNRLAGILNLAVENYNTVNDTRGESFEEGVYYSQGFSRAIDIYEFENREKLVRVLAHELGHALGIGHVEDKKGIMYEFNEGNSEELSKADLEALKARCQIK